MPYDPTWGVPQTFEEYLAAQVPKEQKWPTCLHGRMRRKLAKQGFDYMAFYVCVRDDARCGVLPVATSQVFQQWSAESGHDKESE